MPKKKINLYKKMKAISSEVDKAYLKYLDDNSLKTFKKAFSNSAEMPKKKTENNGKFQESYVIKEGQPIRRKTFKNAKMYDKIAIEAIEKQQYIYVAMSKTGMPYCDFVKFNNDFFSNSKKSQMKTIEMLEKLNLKKGEQVRIPIDIDKAEKV